MNELLQSLLRETKPRILILTAAITSVLLFALALVDLLTGTERNDYVSLIHTDNPINWMTALNLIAAGMAAGRSARFYFSLRENPDWEMRATWSGLAFIFVFGGLDELLDFHERIDGIISAYSAKTQYNSEIVNIFHGTFLLLVYAIGAIATLFLIYSVLREDCYSYYCFCAGVVFQIIALVCERFFQWADSAPKPWVYIAYLEEVSELYGTMFFALAMTYVAINLTDRDKAAKKGGLIA